MATEFPDREIDPHETLADLQRPDALRLHLDELTANELRVAQAAVRYCYHKLLNGRSLAAVRVNRVRAAAVKLFGSVDEAERWLTTPGYFVPEALPVTPYDLAATEGGAKVVEDLILKTAHGYTF